MKHVSLILLVVLMFAPSAQSQTLRTVVAGVDTLSRVVAAASPGDTIELVTNGGVYEEFARVVVNKDLTIRAAANLSQKPILRWRVNEEIRVQASLLLKGIRIEGRGIAQYAMQLRDLPATAAPVRLICEDVDFNTFFPTGEGYALRVRSNISRLIELRFTNCTFDSVGKSVLRLEFPSNGVDSIIYENCTFANCSINGLNDGERCLRIDLGSYPTPPKVRVQNCTFYNIGEDGVRTAGLCELRVLNSIFNRVRDNPVQCDTTVATSTIAFCDTLDNNNRFSVNSGFAIGTIYAEDPEFENPLAYDFTISQFFASNFPGSNGLPLGPPRWYPKLSTSPRESQTPSQFWLYQNYPNPFNPTTVIAYELSEAGDVRLEIFDALGRKVATLVNARQGAGIYSVSLNAAQYGLASGVYFYRLYSGGFSQTKKLMLLK
jgi:hypothetical protein